MNSDENDLTQEDEIEKGIFDSELEVEVPTKEFLLFELDGELYAVTVTDVELVMKIPPVTVVPNAPNSIVGIFHLRGRVIVVLDLLKRMKITRTTSTIPYSLFIAHQGKNYFGILADRTKIVVRVPESEISSLDAMTAAHIPERYSNGKFLYKEEIRKTRKKANDNFMIEPKPTIQSEPKAPIFTERPVVVLNLENILYEEDLRSPNGAVSGSESNSSQS